MCYTEGFEYWHVWVFPEAVAVVVMAAVGEAEYGVSRYQDVCLWKIHGWCGSSSLWRKRAW